MNTMERIRQVKNGRYFYFEVYGFCRWYGHFAYLQDAVEEAEKVIAKELHLKASIPKSAYAIID